MIEFIENTSFLKVQLLGKSQKHILLQKGDAILLRIDIPHAGIENLTENENYKIHCFVTIEDWNENE